MDLNPEAQALIRQLVAQEGLTTQGAWHVREMRDNPDAFFVERPRQAGEAYGVDILGDDSYPTKRADADFVVLAKQLALALKASLPTP